jgi:ACS family hexuronate transporter-like MFS transporter
MYGFSGYWLDRMGTRNGMVVFVCFWSVFQILHGLAVGKWSFAACRFGLGLAEPGSFPAATKAIGEWFPARQRAIGVGIFNTGSVLGASLSAPLVAFLAIHFGWRAAFVFTGALGLVWVVLWLVLYESPQRNRWLSRKEAAELDVQETTTETPAAKEQVNWLKILTSRAGFMLVLARFLTDPVIYFVMFWLPAYLEKERGFSLKMIGDLVWIPWAVGGTGYIFGGWLSGRLIRTGWKLGRSRKMCVVVLGHAIWVTNLMTLPADLFPPGAVAKAAGFSGMGGAMAGALANWFTGSIVAHFSYLPIFIAAGLLHPISMLLLWWLLPERFFPDKDAGSLAATA